MGKFAKSIIFLITLNLIFLANFIVLVTAGEIIAHIEGMLSPGETKSCKFFVDKARTVNIHGSGVVVSERNAKLALILIDPQGKRIDPFAQPAYPSINVDVGEPLKGGGIRSLRINNPAVGYWTAEVTLSENATGIQRYHLRVSCEGSDITLHQDPNNLNELALPGKPSTIKVQLLKNGRPYSDSQASFILRLESKPERANQIPKDFFLQLCDDGLRGDEVSGDGIYAATFMPEEDGEYFFRINVVSSGKFERLAWTAIQVSAQGAHFTGNIKEEPIDNDHNGKYESLKLIAEVEISAEEMGMVEATLRDKAGNVIGEKQGTFGDPSAQRVMPPSADAQLPTTTGVHEISLIFLGKQFLETKSDGPYFAQLQITNPELFAFLPLAELKTPYQTKPYRWQDFE